MIKRDLQNAETKLFSWRSVNVQAKRKNFTYKTVIVAWLKKKTQDFLPFFQTFSRSGKLLGKFQELFPEFKTQYEPWFTIRYKCSSVAKRLGARLRIREEASSSRPALTASWICFSLVSCSNPRLHYLKQPIRLSLSLFFFIWFFARPL